MTQFCVCYCEIQVVPGLSGAFWGWVCCSTLKCVFRGLDFLSSCADSDALSGAPLSQSYGVISETNILRSRENLAIPLSPANLKMVLTSLSSSCLSVMSRSVVRAKRIDMIT